MTKAFIDRLKQPMTQAERQQVRWDSEEMTAGDAVYGQHSDRCAMREVGNTRCTCGMHARRDKALGR